MNNSTIFGTRKKPIIINRFLFILLAFAALPAKAQLLSDSTYFHQGNATRETFVWLEKSGIIRTYFTCSVCPGDETLGLYEIKGDTLLITHKFRFMYFPHHAKVTDTSYEIINWRDTLYYVSHKTGNYLCYDKKDFEEHDKMFIHSENQTILSEFFLRQRSRYE